MTNIEAFILLMHSTSDFIEPSFSFVLGALIYYLYKIDNDIDSFSIRYFLYVLILSFIVGHYSYSILLEFVKPSLITASNFILGLFVKILFDILLRKSIVTKILKRIFNVD